ncbi:MAG: hypothetical protein V4558_04075 [Gemmatimonadota bacterium]
MLRKSHIIPEFLYRLTYDEKHRFVLVNRDPDTHPKVFQQGLREDLLCDGCEVRLSRYEGHASRVIGGDKRYTVCTYQDRYVIQGVDYARMKLFWMSVLWRMSISALEMFRAVRLGPHEDTIRRCLDAEDPGGPLDYPALFLAPTVVPGLVLRSLQSPEPFRILGHKGYRWVVGGIVVVFVVDRRRLDASLEELVLGREGELVIIRDRDGSAAKVFNQLIHGMESLARVHRPDSRPAGTQRR